MSKAIRFRQEKLPKQPGEIARLRVKKGADAGTTFVVFSLPVSIGRGEENQLVLADLKASRKHAIINREPKGRWFIQDNGSANGILYKEKSERQFLIQHGSSFEVGETELEFVFADLLPELQPKSGAKGVALASTPSLNPLTGLPMARPAGSPGAPRPGAPRAAGGGGNANPNDEAAKKKKKMLLIGALAIGGFLMFQETQKPKKPPVKVEPKRDLASLLPEGNDPGFIDTGDALFRAGFREYREKNFLRAKTLFENARDVSPGHLLAEKYLAQAESAIVDDIQLHLRKGREEMNTGRLKTARGHYESVLRLLYRTPTAPAAEEAKIQIDHIKKKMKAGLG